MAFRIVVIATLVAAFFQVTLGGVVRVTGSGLGCPDWPLCHGQIIPPFELATLLEYSHRLSASALSVLMLGVVGMAWVYHRSNSWVMVPSVLGLGMVFVAAVLGGITVLTELTWWVRLIHLGIAEIVVAAMVFVAVAGWQAHRSGSRSPPAEAGRFNRLVLTTIAGVFFLVLSGSYIVGAGAGSSCATWPLCRGELFPEGSAYAIHMGHRYLAALVGLLVLGVAAAAWMRRAGRPEIGWAGLALAVAFIVQVMVGALTVWSGFDPAAKAVHLSAATLVWIALVWLAALAYTPVRFEWGRAPKAAPQSSELRRLAQ